MSLLTDEEIEEVNAAMLDIFLTFRRDTPFVFYKPAEEEVVIFDDSFNADLSEFHNPNVTYIPQYQSFNVRVIYPKREGTLENFFAGGANLQIKSEQDLGIVQIQMEQDAYDYIKDSIRFTFMGDKYQKLTSPRKLGVLGTFTLYQITLKKVN